MSKNQRVYNEDILQAIQKIETYTSEINTYELFEKNPLVIDAVIRNLAIIGEAVKNISSEIRKQNDEIEWKKIAGLRDLLIHAYSGIDLEVIWDVVQNKLLELKKTAERILKEL